MLTERENILIECLVKDYISKGNAISSDRLLEKTGLNCSTATIRKDLIKVNLRFVQKILNRLSKFLIRWMIALQKQKLLLVNTKIILLEPYYLFWYSFLFISLMISLLSNPKQQKVILRYLQLKNISILQ